MPIFFSRATRARLVAFFAAIFAVNPARADAPRIVSLSPAITEIIFQLGAGDYLVGRSDACDYPPESQKIPLAGSFGKPALEKIFQLHPTLLIANDLLNPTVAQTLAPLGIEVVILPCENLANYRRIVATLGEKLGVRDAAAAELARLDRQLAQLAALPPLAGNLLAVIWDAPLMVAGKKSLINEALTIAKIANAADFDTAYYKCSFEWILRCQPDFLLWTPPSALPRHHHLWRELAAIKSHRALTAADLNLNRLQRPSPRFLDGVMELRAAIEKVKLKR